MHDVRYAFRRLASTPGFTAVAVLSLALGIGANTAMFSLVNAILFRDPHVQDRDRLVEVYTADDNGFKYSTSSVPDYLSLRDASTDVFEGVLAYEIFIAQNNRGDAAPLVMGELVTGNYFDVLGVRMAAGRAFLPEEDVTAGTHPVVVLGYGYWQSVFAGDPAVIGQTVMLNRRPYTIVGVAPKNYEGAFAGIEVQLYVPMMMANVLMPGTVDRLNTRGSRSLFMKARLREGTTVQRAASAIETISRRLETEFPQSNAKRIMNLVPSESVSIHPIVDKALVPVAALLLAVVGMVLLIACANLASFLLARGADRRKEIIVRLALGAGRSRIVRQLLVESSMLSVGGGILGLVLAYVIVQALISFQPPLPIPIELSVDLDRRVLAFTALISMVSAIAFGLTPALQATRQSLAPTLRDEASHVTGARRRVNLRNFLVAGQVAVSLVLLVVSGLFVRSLQKAQHIDPGFYTGDAAILWPNLELSGYERERGRQIQSQLAERLRQLPGITHVAMADRLPLGAGVMTRAMRIDGVQPPAGRDRLDIDFAHVDHNYFEALEVPIVRGRAFTSSDREGSEAVVIVSEAAARAYWPGREAVGQIIYVDPQSQTPHRVVGVARDTRVRTLGEQPRPYVYFSAEQEYIPSMQVVARGQMPAPQLLAAARRAALDLDPQLVLLESKTMEQHLALMLFPPRMAALLLSVFGGLALVLAGVGLYGLVSYAVARRTREIGIRMALGASSRDVVGLMTRGGMKLVMVGGACGLLLAAAATFPLSRFLYGVGTTDLATFVAIPAILGTVAFLACYVPARRASRSSPLAALRSE